MNADADNTLASTAHATSGRRARQRGQPEPDTVVVEEAAARRLLAGHLWVYKNQLVHCRAEGGSVVRVTDQRRRLLGRAMYSSRSTIALRLLTREDAEIDAAWIAARFAAARRRRERQVWRSSHPPDAYRLIHAEADGLPAVVVDIYREHAVVQTLTLSAERLLPLIEEALIADLGPASILLRNDPAVREIEGLPRAIRQLRGKTPSRVALKEGAVHLRADLHGGNKTGLFLDQAANHALAERLGNGRVLDCFSYDGGFGLHAARCAQEVLAIDISADVIERARSNAALNGFENIQFIEGNAFDLLRQLHADGKRFDLVILDPPAFAKNRASVKGAIRGYKEINLRAMKLLLPGGFLITSSCSYHLSETRFADILRSAAADARREVEVLERRGQAGDHPVLLGVPETAYLKCWVLAIGGPIHPRRS